MSLLNQNLKEGRSLRRVRSLRDTTDFAKVGGLHYHLKVLREVIILPLLHGNVFSHFKIKAPKGVLFHGPPGTGKTLVAGALASEINKEGIGKVSFFQRKGADVLNKWVGESEKNLRALFEKATKCRPSIIFFDELDGLAPVRSERNDHIHSSIVATLLALMDGLDAKSGVIVIGATNRIDAIDPALRRPGRFDRELYFPLPGVEARKEIIQVHVSPWKYKPSTKFIEHLADITSGFSGSDLQALCSEAVLCCLRRMYPKVEAKGFKIKIEAETLMIEECDFLEARMNIIPSSMKQGQKVRSLSNTIKPLLIRQQTRILRYIRLLWPHFLQEDYRYSVGDKRYAGRIVIIGSNTQGLNSHLMPSILKYLEHLPCFVYDVRAFDRLKTNLAKIQYGFPAVILLSRIDEWWNSIEECDQQGFTSGLEDIHANLPIFIIATCENEVPTKLHNFFYNNSTILIRIEDPTDEERENFLAPLFWGEKILSLYRVWENVRKPGKKLIKCEPVDDNREANTSSKKKRRTRRHVTVLGTISSTIINPTPATVLDDDCTKSSKRKRIQSNHALTKRIKLCEGKFGLWRSNSAHSLYDLRHKQGGDGSRYSFGSLSSIHCLKNRTYFTRILSDIVRQRNIAIRCSKSTTSSLRLCENLVKDHPKDEHSFGANKPSTAKKNSDDKNMEKIYSLWKHASLITSKHMTVIQLELLYDVISACISIHQSSFVNLVESLDNALKKIENSYEASNSSQ